MKLKEWLERLREHDDEISIERGGWLCLCTACGERSLHVSISPDRGEAGKVLLRCDRGCAEADILRELGIECDGERYSGARMDEIQIVRLVELGRLASLVLNRVQLADWLTERYWDLDGRSPTHHALTTAIHIIRAKRLSDDAEPEMEYPSVALAIQALADQNPAWSGTMGELHRAIIAAGPVDAAYRADDWPATPRQLRSMLGEYRSTLDAWGITVDILRRRPGHGGRMVRITQCEHSECPVSAGEKVLTAASE